MVAAIALLQLLRPAPRARFTSQRARVVLVMPTNAMYPYSRDDDAYLWNHAASPNTGNHPDGDGDGVSSYALRDIEAAQTELQALASARRMAAQ